MKKSKKWARTRHEVVWFLLFQIFSLWAKLRYRAKVDSFRKYSKTPCVLLYNHVTGFDQFFVAISFGRPVYFVATEDIFSNGFISKLLRFLVAPIPIRKHTVDLKAMKNILQIVKEGKSIALAPEGNRTYSGRTVHMKDSVASLCKKLKLDIVLYKIEGGYGTQPRWSDSVRKGRMHCYVSKVLKPEDYSDMSEEELYKLIKEELYTDEATDTAVFKGNKRAEYLERAMYVCPDCGFSTFESTGNKIKCLKCEKTILYNEDTSLSGEGFDFPYRFVADWYEYQNEFVNSTDLTALTEKPVYADEVSLYRVIIYKKKELLDKNAKLSLYGDRIVVESREEEKTIALKDITGIACMGRNKLNIEYDKTLYQIKGSKRFNALKYLNFCYRYNNIVEEGDSETSQKSAKGENNVKFLGI